MVASEQVEAAPLPDPVGALLREAAGVCQGAWLLGPVIHGHVTGRAQVEGGGGTLAVGRLERSALKSVAEGLDARLDEEAGALRVLMGGDDVEVDVVDLSTLDEARGGESSGPVQGILSLLARFDVAAEAVAVGADGAVVDPFDGVADLRRRRVRTIGAARGLFREQPAAILRVASAVARLGFDAESECTRFATRDSANLLSAPRETWMKGINEVLLSRRADRGLDWLHRVRALNYLLPEVASLVDFHKTCEVHHKDCWDHTLKVINKSSLDLCTRWAALCHDVGKIWTRTVDRRGKVHFYRHEEFGSVLFEGIAARFRMDTELAHRVASVIRLHGRVNLYESEWTDSAVRRMVRDVEPHLRDLIRFSRADYTSKRPGRAAEIRRQLDELEARIVAITEEDARRPPLPKGLGHALIEELGLQPGPVLGRIRKGLEALCEREEIRAHEEVPYYVERVRELGVDFVADQA